MSEEKPAYPKLPGRYGTMTAAELKKAFSRYDTAGTAECEIAAAAGKPHRPHPPKRGRPAKAEAETVERVLISIEPGLLQLADAYILRHDLTRSGWISMLIREALAQGSKASAASKAALPRATKSAVAQPTAGARSHRSLAAKPR